MADAFFQSHRTRAMLGDTADRLLALIERATRSAPKRSPGIVTRLVRVALGRRRDDDPVEPSDLHDVAADTTGACPMCHVWATGPHDPESPCLPGTFTAGWTKLELPLVAAAQLALHDLSDRAVHMHSNAFRMHLAMHASALRRLAGLPVTRFVFLHAPSQQQLDAWIPGETLNPHASWGCQVHVDDNGVYAFLRRRLSDGADLVGCDRLLPAGRVVADATVALQLLAALDDEAVARAVRAGEELVANG